MAELGLFNTWYDHQSELPQGVENWKYCLAKDRRSGSAKQYIACDSYERMMLNLEDQDNAYEVIACKDASVWCFVDCDRPGREYTDGEILRAARAAIESRMAAEGIGSGSPIKLYVSVASTAVKTSVHLKYQVLFGDVYALEAFIKRVIADVFTAGTLALLFTSKKGLNCVLDASVYTNFRLYRCLGMTKIGRDAPLVAVDAETASVFQDDTMEEHLVKKYDEVDMTPDHVVPALGSLGVIKTPAAGVSKPVRTSGLKTVLTKVPVPGTAAGQDAAEHAALCAKYTEYLNGFDELTKIIGGKIVVSRVTLKSYRVYVCSIKKDPSHVCPYAGRCHESNNLFVVHNESKKKLTLRCHDEACFHRNDVSFVVWETTAVDTDMWDRRELDNMHGQQENIVWSEVYDEPIMRDYPLVPVACVRAGMGLGKTQALIRLAEANFTQNTKALMVTYSQALAAKLFKDFAKYGFVNYKDCDGQIIDAKVVVCLDSMHRVATSMFDFVFLDEAVSLFLHFNSPLMGNKTSINLSLLEMSIIQARHVYFLDACMDHTFGKNIVDYFCSQKKCAPHWIYNRHIRESNRYMKLDIVPMEGANAVTKASQVSRAVGKVLGLVSEGKNVVVCSSSKSFTIRLQNFIRSSRPETNMLVYNSDTTERLDNVEKLWRTCQLLIYSPTITAGVSFEGTHFHSLVAFVSNSHHAPTVDMTLQQLFRVRNLTDGDMHLYIHEKNIEDDDIQYPRTQDAIENFLQSDIALASKYFSTYKINVPGVYRPSENHTLKYDTQRLSFIVILGIIMMRNRSTVLYSDIMISTLFRDYNIRSMGRETHSDTSLSRVELDMLKTASKKADPLPWSKISNVFNDLQDDDEELTTKEIRAMLAAIKSVKTFMNDRWKTRTLNDEETSEFYERVKNEDEALDNFYKASRFVQACDCPLETNKSAFVNSVVDELDDIDPNIVLFKGRRHAYAMKVVIGQRFLQAILDDQGRVELAELRKVTTTEDRCLAAYNEIVADMKPQERAKFGKMFEVKVVTGFASAKKILGSCFGLDVTRKDRKCERKHYTTLIIQQSVLLDMVSTFGADLRRKAIPTECLFVM